MKSYPSISGSRGQDFQEFDAYVFDKLDGSNLRWEWARKGGWCKQGTRTRLFDETDPVFGCAIKLFQETLAGKLESIGRDQRWERMIAFTEFYGSKSFAGQHDQDEPKHLALFDVAVYKKGLLGPAEYLKLFASIEDQARFLGRVKWTRGFVQQVREDKNLICPGFITLEGVVGKAGESHKLVMAKAKTQTWVDKVLALHGEVEGRKIVES